MKSWMAAAAVVLLPGGSVIALGLYLRHRWLRRAQAHAASLIGSPVKKYSKVDEALRIRTEKRRKAADDIRKRAAKVESGASVSDVLRAVK